MIKVKAFTKVEGRSKRLYRIVLCTRSNNVTRQWGRITPNPSLRQKMICHADLKEAQIDFDRECEKRMRRGYVVKPQFQWYQPTLRIKTTKQI